MPDVPSFAIPDAVLPLAHEIACLADAVHARVHGAREHAGDPICGRRLVPLRVRGTQGPVAIDIDGLGRVLPKWNAWHRIWMALLGESLAG